MKRKKQHKNKVAQKDYNPFDELWFWLRLASISIDTNITFSHDKNYKKQNHRIEKQNSYPTVP